MAVEQKTDRLRPLSHQELDERMQDVVASLEEGDVRTDEPRWISARELVDRVRPFIVLN